MSSVKAAEKRLRRVISGKDLKKQAADEIGNMPVARRSSTTIELSHATPKQSRTSKRRSLYDITATEKVDPEKSPKSSRPTLSRNTSMKRFSPRDTSGKKFKRVTPTRSDLTQSEPSQPILQKSTSAVLPKFISETNTPMKISKKLKRSLQSNTTRETARRSEQISLQSVTIQPENMALLDSVLGLIGLDIEDRNSIMFSVCDMLQASENPEKLNKQRMKHLNELIKGANEILSAQKKHTAATTLQSWFRTGIIRKRLKASDFKQIKNFNTAVFNLIDMEKKYIDTLKDISENFLKPIRAKVGSAKPIMTIADVSLVFSSVESILQLHEKNLCALNLALNDWPFVSGIGDILLSARTDLQVYNVYVSNFNKARDTIQRLSEDKNSKFLAFLQENHCSLSKFLEKISSPLYHLSKVAVCVERLPPLCLSGSKEEQQLNLAYSMLHETAKFVRGQVSISEEVLKVSKIQRRLTGYDKPLNLEQEHIKFLLETQFTLDGHKRVLILFNEFLIIGKPLKSSQIKVQEKLDLNLVFYELVEGDPCAFTLKSAYGVHQIQGTAKQITEWIEKFNEYLPSRARRNPTFGKSIQELTAREKTKLPTIVTQIIEYIEESGSLTTEGLFRISADLRELDALKELFDNYTSSDRDLSKYSIHAICGVLKLWLRELPEPLLSFDMYDTIVHLERDKPPNALEMYHNLLPNIGDYNLPTLEYLIRFLRKLCDNSAKNKMSESNVAIVFGPTLIRAKIETIETTLNSPIVNTAIQGFLENVEYLFGKDVEETNN